MGLALRTVVFWCCACTLLTGQVGSRDLRIESVAAEATKSFDKEVKVALVVGISSYPQGGGVSSLKYAARDAELLANVLKSQGYLVRLLTDSNATRSVIRRALREIADAIIPNQGTVLFFFGGHGFTYKGANYLATFGVTADDLDGEGLPVKDVEELLRATKARRKMLFIDACRNEPAQGTRSTAQRSFEKLEASEGMRVLYSTKEGRVSFEDDALRQGIFTYFLVKGLQGEAAPADGWVTFRDLAEYLTDRMRAYTLERGQLQIPFEAGESSGDFLLGKALASGATGSVPVPGVAAAPGPAPPVVAPPRPKPDANPVAGSERRPGTIWVNPMDGLPYVWVPPGRFRMGCSSSNEACESWEHPAHMVTITKGYWMGQTAVSQEAYGKVTGKGPSDIKAPKRPVENVTWNDSDAYCRAVGLRLPTEAEWEYAARAGSTGPRYGDLSAIAWYFDNSGGETHDVGTKDANSWGLYGMLGNVMQWVGDWYVLYSTAGATDPTGPGAPGLGGNHRVARGASFRSFDKDVRVSSRHPAAPAIQDSGVGFRCAGLPEPPSRLGDRPSVDSKPPRSEAPAPGGPRPDPGGSQNTFSEPEKAVGAALGLPEADSSAMVAEGDRLYGRRDYSSAARLYRRAADAGNVVAMKRLGQMYKEGVGVQQDYKEMVAWYRRAADGGDVVSIFNVGAAYTAGTGVPRDDKEALRWYRMAADRGDADAIYNMGVAYTEGKGVSQDHQEALRWYRLAADKGSVNAFSNIGACYEKGNCGVRQDYREAMRWYRMAADKDSGVAMGNIASLYLGGRGVPVDYNQGLYWLRRAAAAGYEPAKKVLADLARSGVK